MKNSIQTKRDTGQKGVLKILSAKTRGRKKQRAVAATPEDLGADVPNVGVGRALIVILVLHVVAIGAVIMHTSWTDKKQGEKFTSDTPAVLPVDDNEQENKPKPKPKTKPKERVANNGQNNQERPDRRNDRPETNNVARNEDTAPDRNTVVDRPATPNNGSGHSIIPNIKRDPVHETIPVANVEPQPDRAASGSGVTHTVSKGDTLWGLSRKYKVSVASIQELNGLKGNNIKLGQELKIK